MLLNCAHLTQLVIFDRLMDFLSSVHHKWAVPYDWFIQGHSRNKQHFQCTLCISRIFDTYLATVAREENHLTIGSLFAFCSERSFSVNNVRESVVVAWHVLCD